MSADYQGENRAGAGGGAGDSRRPGCGRWIGNPRLECSRRFTLLWIGTTAKVRLTVVPLSSGWWSAGYPAPLVNIRSEFEKCKPRRTIALTAYGSPRGNGEDH